MLLPLNYSAHDSQACNSRESSGKEPRFNRKRNRKRERSETGRCLTGTCGPGPLQSLDLLMCALVSVERVECEAWSGSQSVSSLLPWGHLLTRVSRVYCSWVCCIRDCYLRAITSFCIILMFLTQIWILVALDKNLTSGICSVWFPSL